MAELTRRGLFGGLAALGIGAAAASVGLPEAKTEASMALPPPTVPEKPLKCPPRRHCRICDKAFAKKEVQMPIIDFYVMDMKEGRPDWAERGEPVPQRDLYITSGVDMVCKRCFEKFSHGEERAAEWTVAELDIWTTYRSKMLRPPR